jgi:putative hemolysin
MGLYVAEPTRYRIGFADTAEERKACFQLRYAIFAGELGADIDGGIDQQDQDHFDPHCLHLCVKDSMNGQLVAYTRLLTSENAPKAGGFYSQGEFDLSMLNGLQGRFLEVGRTCVHPDFRNGAVIGLLWQGIAEFITHENYDYLFGCASLGLEDGGASATAIIDGLRGRFFAEPAQQVRPYYPLHARREGLADKPKLPPLLKAYLSLGAKVCGEAFYDKDFNCADLFMLLRVKDLSPRYARHFLQRVPAHTSHSLLAA